MKINRTGLTRVLGALAAVVGLLGSTSARAEFWSPVHERAGSVRTFWLSPSSEVKAAVRAWDRGTVATAVRRAKTALRRPLATRDRENTLLIACVGETRLGHPEIAMRFCNRAVRSSGARDWRHLNNRANALLQAGHVATAIADYERAIALQTGEHSRAETAKTRLESGPPALDGAPKANLDLALRRQAAGLEGIPAIAAASQKETQLAGGHAGPR